MLRVPKLAVVTLDRPPLAVLHFTIIVLTVHFVVALVGVFLSGTPQFPDMFGALRRVANDVDHGLPGYWSHWPLRAFKGFPIALALLGFVTVIMMTAVIVFVITSPLYVLCCFNALTGRPAPRGRLAQWYAELLVRWRELRRPKSCRGPQ